MTIIITYCIIISYSKRTTRSNKLKDYNRLTEKINFNLNPNKNTFTETRSSAKTKRDQCGIDSDKESEDLRLAKNKNDKIKRHWIKYSFFTFFFFAATMLLGLVGPNPDGPFILNAIMLKFAYY